MKTLLCALALSSLCGCAGLNTVWVFQMQMQYQTPQDKPEIPAIPAGKEL